MQDAGCRCRLQGEDEVLVAGREGGRGGGRAGEGEGGGGLREAISGLRC